MNTFENKVNVLLLPLFSTFSIFAYNQSQFKIVNKLKWFASCVCNLSSLKALVVYARAEYDNATTPQQIIENPALAYR